MMDICEKIREELWDFDENSTDPASEKIKEHLDGCEACRKEYQKIRKIQAELAEYKEEVPSELEEAVMNKLFGASEKTKKKRRYIPIGAVAAAVVVLSVFTVYNSALFGNKDKATSEDYSGVVDHDGGVVDVYYSSLADKYFNSSTTQDRFIELDEFDFSSCDYDGKFPGEISILYFVESGNMSAVLDILGDRYYTSASDGRVMYMGRCDEHDVSLFDGIYKVKYTRSGEMEPKFFAIIMETE